MTDVSQEVLVERALAVARVRAVRVHLMALHKALIDAERQRYERVNGRIEHAHEALHLVLSDPWFRWLGPLARSIVQVDERLADDRPIERADVDAVADRIRRLLQPDEGDSAFGLEYRRSLQDAPEVVVAHGQIVRLLAEFTPPPPPAAPV